MTPNISLSRLRERVGVRVRAQSTQLTTQGNPSP